MYFIISAAGRDKLLLHDDSLFASDWLVYAFCQHERGDRVLYVLEVFGKGLSSNKLVPYGWKV